MKFKLLIFLDLLNLPIQIFNIIMQGNKKSSEVKKQTGRWAPDQHERFMAAIVTYGKDWKKVQQIVKTRTGSQVRSHAQKFFNKLLKQQHSKHSGESKQKPPQHHHEHDHQQSQNQNSFAKLIHDECSNTTPIQLVSLIKGQSLKNNTQKINIKNFQKQLQEKLADIVEQENNEDQNLDALKRQNSYKSMNNILDVYQNLKGPENNTELEKLQNQSFLIKLTKQYKRYFGSGGKFQNLIDFGNPLQVEQAERSLRKRSFTLPEGVEGDQQDLNERKKRVITEQKTAKLTPNQKQGFKLVMNSLTNNQNASKPTTQAIVSTQKIQKKQ